MRDARGRIALFAVSDELHIHAAVASGKKGVFLAVLRLGDDKKLQPVVKRRFDDRLADAGV